MTRDQAIKWFKKVPDGVGPERNEHLKQFDAGEYAKDVWNNGNFILGTEYGIKIAIAKIFDLKPESIKQLA